MVPDLTQPDEEIRPILTGLAPDLSAVIPLIEQMGQ